MIHPDASYPRPPFLSGGWQGWRDGAEWGRGVGERLRHFFMVRELESMLHFVGSSEPQALEFKIRG